MSSATLRIVVATSAICCFCLGSYAAEPSVDGQLRAASDELHRWLDLGDHGPKWRTFLMKDELDAQLARSSWADAAVVAQVLDRYAGYPNGMEWSRFAKVRPLLEQWLAQLPAGSVEDLISECRAAKEHFVPRSEADLQQARAKLVAALDRLDARLKQSGAAAKGWRAYLKWDETQEQLAREEGPDLEALDAIYDRYDDGNEGLSLVWFEEVREALRAYRRTARAIGNAKFQGDYQALMDRLAERLEAYAQAPSAEQAAVVGPAMQWLNDAGQASRVVAGIRHHFAQPNLFAQVSADLIRAALERPIDETGPVEDYILGTSIRGTGRTTGNVTVGMVPSGQRGQILIAMETTTATETTGYNGPARIYSTGTTKITTEKSILVDAEGPSTKPAVSKGVTNSTIHNIQAGGPMAQRTAWSRATAQKPQSERIAAQHAEERANRRVDKQVDEMIRQANDDYQKKIRRPLLERRVFPRELRFMTAEAGLSAVGIEAGPFDLAAPGSPPPAPENVDLAVRVHASAINNAAAEALAGMTLPEERFEEMVVQLLGSLPEYLESEEDAEPWAITFARQLPLSVVFSDGNIEVTLRGRRYTTGDSDFPGMNVTARYKIEKADQTLKAVRQGDLEIFPPGFDPDSGEQLSARQQFLRSLLEKRLGKIFAEEIVPEPIVLPDRLSQAGDLALVHWETADGWLTMGWRRAP